MDHHQIAELLKSLHRHFSKIYKDEERIAIEVAAALHSILSHDSAIAA